MINDVTRDELSVELYQDKTQGQPLIPDDELIDPERKYIYNTDGTFAETRSVGADDEVSPSGVRESTSRAPIHPPCSHATLDGSWYLPSLRA